MLVMQIVVLVLLFIVGTSFVGATATCFKKGQHAGFGVGFMLSSVVMFFMFKILTMLIGG